MTRSQSVNLVVAYDISGRKITKVHSCLSRFLYWEQNSVFFGQVNRGTKGKIQTQLLGLIDQEKDSVLIYSLNYPWTATVERWGRTPSSCGLVE